MPLLARKISTGFPCKKTTINQPTMNTPTPNPTVRAKFGCFSKEESLFGYGTDRKIITKVTLSAVSGTNGENKLFATASPCGTLELGCLNKAAADAFELGREYYLDFTPADAVPAVPAAPAQSTAAKS
jgi:hypothetical protein